MPNKAPTRHAPQCAAASSHCPPGHMHTRMKSAARLAAARRLHPDRLPSLRAGLLEDTGCVLQQPCSPGNAPSAMRHINVLGVRRIKGVPHAHVSSGGVRSGGGSCTAALTVGEGRVDGRRRSLLHHCCAAVAALRFTLYVLIAGSALLARRLLWAAPGVPLLLPPQGDRRLNIVLIVPVGPASKGVAGG